MTTSENDSTQRAAIDRPRTSVTIQTVGINPDGTLWVDRATVEIPDIDPTTDAIAKACERAMLGSGYLPEQVSEMFRG